MSENKWKVGDVVKLKSGGPAMVVTQADGWPVLDVLCEWLANGRSCANFYPPEVLEPAGVESLPQSQIDVQVTADACRNGLQMALETASPAPGPSRSWSELLQDVRNMVVAAKCKAVDEAEAAQTLATAQAEIARLKVDLATERKVHAENYRLLSESYKHGDRIERELASERTLLSEANAKLAAIAVNPMEFLHSIGYSEVKLTISNSRRTVDMCGPVAEFIGTDGRKYAVPDLSPETLDITQARGLLGAKPGEMAKAVTALYERLDKAAENRRSQDRLVRSAVAERDRFSALIEKIASAVSLTSPGDQYLIQSVELHYNQSTIAKRATNLLGSNDAEQLCRLVEELQNQQAESVSIMLALRRILEAKDSESLNQAATRVIGDLGKQSHLREEAEGKLAAIKRALGNNGLLG